MVSERPTVLLVDDAKEMRELYARGLEREGFSTMTADGASSAMALLADVTPDTILLDFTMPEMDGVSLLQSLRAEARFAEVPIILLTACDQEACIEQAFASGATDYLTKPVDRRILAARVRSVIERRSALVRASRAAELERQRDSLRTEIQYALDVQQRQLPRTPDVSGAWTATGALLPCNEVGGDLYDIIETTGGGRTYVLLDVSGHGVGAAMVASSVRGMLRLLLPARGLADVAAELNQHLCRDDTDHYVCLGMVRVDDSGVSVLNAGLPPVALLRSGAVVDTVCASGVPPGLIPDSAYEVRRIDELVDTIVLASDGVTEHIGGADDIRAALGGLALVVDAPRSSRPSTLNGPRDLMDRVDALLGHGSGPQRDDVTVLVLEQSLAREPAALPKENMS